MNLAVNSSMGYVPFEANYGWLPQLIQGIENNSHQGIDSIIENIKDVLDKTHDKLVAQHVHQATQVNKDCREPQMFRVGESVYLHQKHQYAKGQSQKTLPKIHWTIPNP